MATIRKVGNIEGGFTLLELLVVITIIVILLALLTPALDAAMRHAEIAACGGQLHSIGVGIGAYAMDFRKTPQKAGDPGQPEGDTVANGFRAGGGHGGMDDERPASQRPLYEYAGPRGFRCAADGSFDNHGEPAESRWSVSGSSYYMQPSTAEPEVIGYHVNYFATGIHGPQDYFSGVIGRRTTSIRQPHKLIILSDGPAFFAPYDFGAYQGYSYHDPIGMNRTPEGRERAWNNGLFVDGHVMYTRIEGIQDDYVTGEYSFVWNVFDGSRMGSRGQ